jgi:ASC-1-like (ASCH) protein
MSGRSTIGRLLIASAALAAALAATGADAQSYRCVGKDGRKYYGQVPPPQCTGQPTEMLNSQGQVIHRPPPSDSKKTESTAKAQSAKKQVEDPVAREERLRNAALLDTYANEREIELARSRALEEISRARKEIEKRIEEAKKRQAKAKSEMEFYKGSGNPPQALEAAALSAAQDIKSQQNLLEHKMKEADDINAKYDADKRRFIELTAGRK